MSNFLLYHKNQVTKFLQKLHIKEVSIMIRFDRN